MKRLLYIVVALALLACNDDYFGKPTPKESGPMDVMFSLTMPDQVPTLTPTRAYSDTDIENIDLLIFDEANKFLERIKVNTVSGSGNVKTFMARLDASGVSRTIHIVANGRTPAGVDRINFNAITASELESSAIPKLRSNPMTANTASEAMITPLIMWGRANVPAITSSTTVSGVKLLRTQACITVGKAAATAENGLANFEILSATLSATSASGLVAPAAYTNSGAVPMLPNEWQGTRINYYLGDGSTEQGYFAPGPTPLLYLYERENTSTNSIWLLVKATWNGTPGFYKILLNDDRGNLLNIVRNHRYVVTITKAFGSGYNMIERALENEPLNIHVTITDEHEELYFILGGGSRMMGVSVNRVELWGSGPGVELTDQAVELAKVYMSDGSRYELSTNVNGLIHLMLNQSGVPGATVRVMGRWSKTMAAQTGTITISDGLLRHEITVVTHPTLNAVQYPFTSDASSFSYSLMNAPNAPWWAKVEEGENSVRLHPTNGAASAYPGGTGFGQTYLDSKFTSTAFLHVARTGGLARVKVSYLNGTEPVVSNILINR